MKKRDFLTTIYQLKGEKMNLSTILDKLLQPSDLNDKDERQGLFGYYNLGRTSEVQKKFKEINENLLYAKVMILKETRQFYMNLYESIKNEGLSIENTLKLYSDSGINSLPELYKKVMDVYESLDIQEKINFKNELDHYCSITSGRFQPFVSESINWIDEKNIKNLQRELFFIQEDVRKYLQAMGVGVYFPDLLESEHLLLDIRDILSKEISENVDKKYKEYIEKIYIDESLKPKGVYNTIDNEYSSYIMNKLDILNRFMEIIFKNYKNITNPQDINFNQMIELLYYASKSNLLKEIPQPDMDVLDIAYEIMAKLEKDYKDNYDSNLSDDLNKINSGEDYKEYLNRVEQLGYSKGLYDRLVLEHYKGNIDMYRLHLIEKKNNKSIDLDLYNELVFAKNIKYLIESNNKSVILWLWKGCTLWSIDQINQLKANISNLYRDENRINSQCFASTQSDFIVPDEMILKLPSEYLIEDTQVNNKDNGVRIGILLKHSYKILGREKKDFANYYLLHIDINDAIQDKSKFEIQFNLLTGSEIDDRIQIFRMDNYVNKGTHKNTGSKTLDTTTHLHKYNALNKVRRNRNGEMDIYKNWVNGVNNFQEGLDIFLKEAGVNSDLKGQIKEIVNKEISKIKRKKGMR